MNTTCDIAIVGGGAAGLAAAIAAARRPGCAASADPGEAGGRRRVVVLEAADRVGKSILKTGNGRCNFSNAHIADGTMLYDYRNADFVRSALEALAASHPGDPYATHPDPVLDFFEDLGLEWIQEGDGRRYPLANKASVLLDVLRAEAARLGVAEACGVKVESIEAPRDRGGVFTLRAHDGAFWRAHAVVVACGGAAADALDACGIEKKSLSPILGPLRVSDDDASAVRELDNIRVRCSAKLFRRLSGMPEDELGLVRGESGELLFRKYGVSGICVFDLSRDAQPGDTLSIDFLQCSFPDQAHSQLSARRDQLRMLHDSLTCRRFLTGMVLPRVADVVLKAAGLSSTEPVTDSVLSRLESALCHFTLTVEGMGPADNCQVRRGGFPVEAFDAATMEVRTAPGLFMCGEAVDVDGPCGGYNLHWAWASGLLAGEGAARAC